MNKTDNPFWKDVLKAFIKTNENREQEDTLHILKHLFFYNCNICTDKKVCFLERLVQEGN